MSWVNNIKITVQEGPIA